MIIMLLAQADDFFTRLSQSALEELSDADKKALLLVALLLVLVVVGVTIYYLVLRPKLKARRLRQRTFRDLSSANHLSAEDADRIRGYAKATGVEHPSLFFVRPSLFDRLPPGNPDVDRLKKKLFEEA